MDYEVTSRQEWQDGTTTVVVEISDTGIAYALRLVVNGNASRWYHYDRDILAHEGYVYITEYFVGHDLPINEPFRITKLSPT